MFHFIPIKVHILCQWVLWVLLHMYPPLLHFKEQFHYSTFIFCIFFRLQFICNISSFCLLPSNPTLYPSQCSQGWRSVPPVSTCCVLGLQIWLVVSGLYSIGDTPRTLCDINWGLSPEILLSLIPYILARFLCLFA